MYYYCEPVFLVMLFGKIINICSIEQNALRSRTRTGAIRNVSMKFSNLNLKGKTCCKFPADAGFPSDRAHVTAGMLTDTTE